MNAAMLKRPPYPNPTCNNSQTRLRRWVSWQEHLKLLSDFTRLSMTPGAFIPFGFQSLIGSSTNTGGSSGPGGSARAFILTADTLPAIYLLRMLLTARSNILVSGPSGTYRRSLFKGRRAQELSATG